MFNNELYRELIGLNLLNDVMKERLFEDNTRRFYSDDVPVRPGDVKHDA
jgi:hypothetical protein